MISICLLNVIGQNGTISSGTGPEELDAPGEGSDPVSSTAFMPKRLLMKERGNYLYFRGQSVVHTREQMLR